MGRPKKQWNEKTAGAIEALAAYGVPIDKMAKHVHVGENTIPKLYKNEIEAGKAKGDIKILQTAFDLAVNGKNVAMLIFLLKTRLGFREVDRDSNVIDVLPLYPEKKDKSA